MANTLRDQRIQDVRRFNRFYTRKIGVLQEGLLYSPFSLTEARLLYELAHRDRLMAAVLCKELGLDAGYLSRILRRFERRGLISRTASPHDARQSLLALTARGRKAFAPLDRRSQEEVAALLKPLAPADRSRLIAAMHSIENLLGEQPAPRVPYILRPHQPGDMGWIVHLHGALYSRGYGWDDTFEALVAEIVAKFLRNFDAKRERCWVAEREGAIVGSVFLVKKTDKLSQLRLLLVDPSARGLGIGRRLVDECIRFARQTGYRKMTLWTNSVLVAARRIYEAAGFRLVKEEKHHSFGHDLVGQNWDLDL